MEQDTGTPRPAGDAESYTETGEPRVDAALRHLDELEDLPVSEHPAVFEQVHASLREVLGELDLNSGSSAGPAPRRDG
jgi:hypothetical protein